MWFVVIVELFIVEGFLGLFSLLDVNIGLIMVIGFWEGFEDIVVGFLMYVMNDEGDNELNMDW